jgi:hypothetical protein
MVVSNNQLLTLLFEDANFSCIGLNKPPYLSKQGGNV